MAEKKRKQKTDKGLEIPVPTKGDFDAALSATRGLFYRVGRRDRRLPDSAFADKELERRHALSVADTTKKRTVQYP